MKTTQKLPIYILTFAKSLIYKEPHWCGWGDSNSLRTFFGLFVKPSKTPLDPTEYGPQRKRQNPQKVSNGLKRASELPIYYPFPARSFALKFASIFLATLVAGQALGQVDYNRSAWRHWSDFDGDCQNTRQELLIRTSLAPVTFTDTRNCTVDTGVWIGPYTGKVFTLASDVDIDHIIPLKYAHDYGGALWSPLLKKVFANDPENLLVTEDRENQVKSDHGPSAYMPPLAQYQCEYIRRWRFLVAKYELEIDKKDADLIAAIANGCL